MSDLALHRRRLLRPCRDRIESLAPYSDVRSTCKVASEFCRLGPPRGCVGDTAADVAHAAQRDTHIAWRGKRTAPALR